jgi:glycosyltransferase involved in cell wall biosynthesis
MMSFSGIIVSKIKRIPSTMYVLDLWPENLYSVLDIKSSLLRVVVERISHWHYKKADKIIALSEIMKKQLLSITKKNSDNIIILPQASEKIYESSIKDMVLSKRFKGTFNIVYTGNISPAQSFNTLIDSAEKIVASGVEDIRWIIIGDGMSKKTVEATVKAKGLSSYFSFEGQKPIEEMPKYTYLADVFIGCLVKSELLEATIPAKVMSYIASGKPIVLAMSGEVQDLINNKIKCGYASDADDVIALTANIKKLYTLSDEDRAALGKRAKDYHLKHFERTLIFTKMYNFMFTNSKV